MVLADLQFAVAVAKVHPVAQAVAPHLAVGALVGLHPFAVAIDLELVLPHFPEAILIDIALVVVAAYAEAARDRAISQHRRYIDARAARIIMVAYLAFVASKEAAAKISEVYA